MPSVLFRDGYAATIAALAPPPSLQEGTGLWASYGEEGNGLRAGDLAASLCRESAGVFNTGGTMGSNSCQVEDVRTSFVFETGFGWNMSIGGNLRFGSAGPDVSSAIGDGESRTVSHGVAAAVRWRSGTVLYADGQVQYAGFTSDFVVNNEAQVAENEVLCLSSAVEVSYRLDLGSVSLYSRMGLNLLDMEFDDFIDPTLALVSLEDCDLLTGLLGVTAERKRSKGCARGSFDASADLQLPLAGETDSNVAGFTLSNRLQEPVLDLGASASWKRGATCIPLSGRLARRRVPRPRGIASASESKPTFECAVYQRSIQ